MDSPLIYVQVREKLKEKISRMTTGEKLPPERELSTHYRVDRATIRRAMLDLAAEGFVVRCQGRGTFIRRLVRQERTHLTGSKVVGLILPDLEIPQNIALLRAIEAEASRRGYQIWVRNAVFDRGKEREILETIGGEELAGIMTCPIYGNTFDRDYAAVVNRILAGGRNVVLLDQYVPGCEAPVAMVDKFKVGYIATEHLIMTGHRRICYVSTHTFDTSGNDSYRGYRQALEDYGVGFDEQLTIDIPVESAAKPAHDAVVELLKATPRACTAIATPQFAMAYGIFKALTEMGIRIGEDLVLVGNNLTDNPDLCHLPYTHQPFDEVGKAAVGLLLEEPSPESRRKHALISPRLVV